MALFDAILVGTGTRNKCINSAKKNNWMEDCMSHSRYRSIHKSQDKWVNDAYIMGTKKLLDAGRFIGDNHVMYFRYFKILKRPTKTTTTQWEVTTLFQFIRASSCDTNTHYFE